MKIRCLALAIELRMLLSLFAVIGLSRRFYTLNWTLKFCGFFLQEP